MIRIPSDTELYKCTYRELVLWIKELFFFLQRFSDLENLNYRQARIIMELEHEVKMAKEYGQVVSDVVSLDEFRANRIRRKGGGGPVDGGNFLTGMKLGTEFLVRPRGGPKSWLLVKFMFATPGKGWSDAGVELLIPMRGDEPIQDEKEWVWVDPIEFCKAWELRAVLLIPEEENE